MFAEASSWNRPIRFRGGVGGHLDAISVQRAARRAGGPAPCVCAQRTPYH